MNQRKVYPKKNLGQHFLTDKYIAGKIVDTLTGQEYSGVLEIGPGMGILTGLLLERAFPNFHVIELDHESVHFLKERFHDFENIIQGDFLRLDLDKYFIDKVALIGNFPYNISSQILFRVLHYRNKVVEVCGMFQKEVAERICAGPGTRVYGIMSVLIQAFYSAEYMFTVPGTAFYPPPRVSSGVIRLIRNDVITLECDEDLFFKVVKTCFNQRRKMLRNSVKSGFGIRTDDCEMFHMRPEQLSVNDFVKLTNWIAGELKKLE